MNTCIHWHRHISSNTILVNKMYNCQSFRSTWVTPFRSIWVHTLPEYLSSHPSAALEFTHFRSTWGHTLPKHLSSHTSGALEFTHFRSTWVHIRFLVVFVFVFIGLFFYVVFYRSLSVPFVLSFKYCVLSSFFDLRIQISPLVSSYIGINKNNNKITELRTILQRESQNS